MNDLIDNPFFIPGALSVASMGYVAAIAYAVRYSQTNVNHLRSFTPVCANCGYDIRADNDNAPHPKVRLRDHIKVCEA